MSNHRRHFFHIALSALILVALLFWSVPEGTLGWTNPGQNPPLSSGAFNTIYNPTSGSIHFGLGASGADLMDKLTIGDGSFYQGAPINPVVVGGHELCADGADCGLPGEHKLVDIAVSGKYAYLLFGGVGGNAFRIVDVSNPADPEVVGGAGISGFPSGGSNIARKIAVAGSYAYIVFDVNSFDNGSTVFRIIDVSNPSSPMVLGGDNLRERPIDDACDASGKLPRDIEPTDIAISGRYAYIAFDGTGNCALRIVDVSDPADLRVIGGHNIVSDSGSEMVDNNACRARGVSVSGRYAYMTFGGEVSGVTCINPGTNDAFRIIDVADPIKPKAVGGSNLGYDTEGMPDDFPYANDIQVSGRYAYMTFYHIGGGGYYNPTSGYTPVKQYLRIVDISNPESPVVQGGQFLNDFVSEEKNVRVYPNEIFPSGRYLYMAMQVDSNVDSPRNDVERNRQFRVVDVVNPTSPIIVGGQNLYDNMPFNDGANLDNNDSAQSVFVSGRYAYVGFSNYDDPLSKNKLFRIIDITGIESTSVLAHSLETGTLQVRTSALVDNNLDVRGSLNVAGHTLFNGNAAMGALDIWDGKLTAADKTFLIDHPLDPENKYLRHSAVEAPEMENLYDGIAVLDAKGEAVVTMPPWFEALNKNFRYLLTPIGSPAPNLYVKEGIKNNRFTIAGGPPFAKISWQVTGIRQDPWALANPLIVEGNKPEPSYLYPELYR